MTASFRFYASWCKSCQKFGTKYRKLAYDEGDQLNAEGSITQLGNVRFAEVEYTANAQVRSFATIPFNDDDDDTIIDDDDATTDTDINNFCF